MANDKQELERKNELLCLAIEHQRDELARVRGLLQRGAENMEAMCQAIASNDNALCAKTVNMAARLAISLREASKAEPSAETGGELNATGSFGHKTNFDAMALAESSLSPPPPMQDNGMQSDLKSDNNLHDAFELAKLTTPQGKDGMVGLIVADELCGSFAPWEYDHAQHIVKEINDAVRRLASPELLPTQLDTAKERK